MKKICLLLSMLMIVCMLGTTAFAAGTTDAAITLDVDKSSVAIDEEFTLTVGYKGDSAAQPIYGTAKVVVTWDPEYIEFVSGSADDSTFELTNATTYTESGLANNKITYSQKVLNTEDRPAGDNVFGKITFKAIKAGEGSIWLDGTTAVYVNSATTTTTRVALAEDTTATVTITSGGDDEEVFEITKTESAVAGTDTMKDADGKDVAAAGDEVVAIFAKNVSDAELAAGTYGIVFGGVRYAGQAVVPAKTAWAIKLVGSADQLPAGSYAYSIFAGDAVVEATAPWVID